MINYGRKKIVTRKQDLSTGTSEDPKLEKFEEEAVELQKAQHEKKKRRSRGKSAARSSRITYRLKIQDQPSDIICEIFAFLAPLDLKNVAAVCKEWYQLSNLNRLWQPLAAHCLPITTSFIASRTHTILHSMKPAELTDEELFEAKKGLEPLQEGAYKQAYIYEEKASGLYLVQKHDKDCETWRWKVKGFRAMKNFVYSDPFTVGGHPWRLLIFPKGNHQPEHFSIYLDVADSDQHKDKNWTRHATYTFGVLNRANLANSWVPEKLTKEKFWKQERDWGYRQFMSLEHLNSEGFIVDDTLTLEITIQVRHTETCCEPTPSASSDAGEVQRSEQGHEEEAVVAAA